MKQIYSTGGNKLKKAAVILIILGFACLVLNSCKEDTSMTIDERIKAFASGLNDSVRNDLKEHFHSDSNPSTFNEAYWETKFPNDGGQVYSRGTITNTGSNTRDVKITGGTYDSGDTFSFTMKEEDEDDWYILRIDLNGGTFIP